MIKAILEVCRAASAFERAKQGLTLRNDGPGGEHGISLVHPGQAALLLVENARSELLAKLLELPIIRSPSGKASAPRRAVLRTFLTVDGHSHPTAQENGEEETLGTGC